MDVYHKVLQKLFEVTGGRDSQTVDLKELVKGQGFLGNYNDIFQMLSSQGWIAETPKANYVKITHWGVKETKKTQSGAPDTAQIAKKEAARLISDTRHLAVMLEEFSENISQKNLAPIERKIDEIKTAIAKLKNDIE